MKTSVYKLGEYKIIETITGDLRWEGHAGLGMRREGSCYQKGAILFIGPPESERSGLLKGEFAEQLQSFPDWRKTAYYSKDIEVYRCDTLKKPSQKEMRLWTIDPTVHGGGGIETDGGTSYRLSRYEIFKKDDGHIMWKTYAGPKGVSIGACIILEDILFIGPRQYEEADAQKRSFLAHLAELPAWPFTTYFCPFFSLVRCHTGALPNEKPEFGISERKNLKSPMVVFSEDRTNLENPYLFCLKIINTDNIRRLVKWTVSAAAFILPMASALFGFISGCLKKLRRRRADGKPHPLNGRFENDSMPD